jgi:hypothetical protein
MDKEMSQLPEKPEIFEIFYFTRRFITEVDNIADTLEKYVPLAIDEEQKSWQTLVAEIEQIRKHIEDTEDQKDIILSESTLTRILNGLMKTVNSPKPALIAKSLFIYLFTSIENLISDLLFFLYLNKRDLLNSIERGINLNQLLYYRTVNDIVADLIMKELETFRRNSFVKQFALLEHKFGIKLTTFENWPAFVECAQRRNLFTHCNGIVSQQYIEECQAVGYKLPDEIKIGSPLHIDQIYFANAINIIREVGIKLSQTLWRKFFPERLNEADGFLINYCYELLMQQNWALAEVMGAYAADLKNKYDDAGNRVMHINLAIAVYNLRSSKDAKKILHQLDWSACIDDFRLAVEVLSDNFAEAARLMQQIGATGKYVTREAYLEWPLFNHFRKIPCFLEAYRHIYGSDFIADIKAKVEHISIEKHPQLSAEFTSSI